MKFSVIKLGTPCKEMATALSGMITHWTINMDRQVQYLFQPKGLDENGKPLKKMFCGPARLEAEGSNNFEEVEVPFEILGSRVTDKASGFTGTAVEFVRHINGCFHVAIQPAGLNAKTKAPFDRHEFDLRLCTGEKITLLSENELKQSRENTPSPTDDSFEREVPGDNNLGNND